MFVCVRRFSTELEFQAIRLQTPFLRFEFTRKKRILVGRQWLKHILFGHLILNRAFWGWARSVTGDATVQKIYGSDVSLGRFEAFAYAKNAPVAKKATIGSIFASASSTVRHGGQIHARIALKNSACLHHREFVPYTKKIFGSSIRDVFSKCEYVVSCLTV